jgi:hypothetical protein
MAVQQAAAAAAPAAAVKHQKIAPRQGRKPPQQQPRTVTVVLGMPLPAHRTCWTMSMLWPLPRNHRGLPSQQNQHTALVMTQQLQRM